jgi:hypothetical protein
MRALGVIALSLGIAATAASASTRPALRVTDLSPFTVHGYRFESGQSLRVVITTKHRFVRRLETNDRGAFTIRLRLSIGRCAQWSVAAYGPSGLLAAVKSPPQSCGADLSNP